MFQIPYVESGMLLFRFMDHRAGHFWPALSDILSEQKLFLNSRTNFNDPYDSRPEIDNDLRSSDIRRDARELVQDPWNSQLGVDEISTVLMLRARGTIRLSKAQINALKNGMHRSAEEFLDGCGLTSFSLNAEHPLLWAHYAAGYSGICVVFRRNSSRSSGLSLCAKVAYVDRRPNLPLSLFYEMRQTQRAGKSIDEITDKIFFLSFLHKSKEWEYEREARIYYPFEATKKFDLNEMNSSA
jgi:hypothetical protein